MRTPLRVLSVEDSADDARLVARALADAGYAVAWERVETEESMRAALAARTRDVIVADYNLPDFNGLAALRIVRDGWPDLPFILISGSIGEEIAVEAMKAGASDYVMKDRLVRLGCAISARASSTTPPHEIPHGHGELILVVDDDDSIRELVADVLEQVGYRVLSCTDGMEVMTKFSSRLSEFALVITDSDMPRLGGAELVGALRQIRPEFLVLAISGMTNSPAADPNLPNIRDLAQVFLLKPFQAHELIQAVNSLMHPARMGESP